VLSSVAVVKLHRRFLFCVLASTLSVGFVAPGIAVGQTSPDPKARRDELSGAIEDASANEIAAIKELQQATAQRQELEAKVAALDGEIADATQKVEVAEAEIARLQAQVETVQREVDWIHAEIEKLQAQLNESTVALYKGSGNGGGSALRLLSNASGAHELVAGSKYLGENSRRVERELQRQGNLKAQLDEAERDLKNQKAKAQEAERAAADERDRVTQLRAAADAERNHAIAAVAQEQQIIEGIRARRAEFEAEYNAVQAQIQAQIAASVSRGNPTPPAPAAGPKPGPPSAPAPGPAPASTTRNSRFIWPVNGSVGSGFGPRIHPISGGSRMHTGVDIGASSGTPIKAADDGVVVMAGPNGGYGNWTLIDHGGGLATGYGHQSSIGVSRGQRVSRGQVIGRVGSTGASTGPHLHWEVRVNGNPVDPMRWA
jgi:murein DD-endopeptidase MepM/ murein hydrolase activator NlpD